MSVEKTTHTLLGNQVHAYSCAKTPSVACLDTHEKIVGQTLIGSMALGFVDQLGTLHVTMHTVCLLNELKGYLRGAEVRTFWLLLETSMAVFKGIAHFKLRFKKFITKPIQIQQYNVSNHI